MVHRHPLWKLLMYLSNCIRAASYSANTFQTLKVDTNKLPTYDTASDGTMTLLGTWQPATMR